mmetsp:Transcript_6709/g.11212  ORF Transcript_6709/g.11212 Transcript_6709/m.11212 type:complete len:613 (+) Transcript_6709:52-1890(+)|eukprot:CAMPEP_0174962864 /NCGR_PEP_ID=MMETSP0004_2-20121128/5008_1 /TAXON_ID=420556 /ORGANISM="Ochromonas sp., Strain CCMP1393" /LENGTH=612 /DNA_ID=CAMNT_0016211419 /DNA_START=52 /DNA_END=1890 /DNA_ORIENTATION=-
MTEKEPQMDQDGKMINPHNPDFITKVPWYLGNSGPTLKHHAVQKVDHFLSLNEADALINQKLLAQKSAAQSAPKTVYRKGACRNCGAMTHKEKDCVERPRSSRKAAWKSGLDIAPDEVTMDLEKHGKVSFDAKRDQWKGYDANEYKEIVDKHERLEKERLKQRKEQKEQRQREIEEKQKKRKEEKEQRKLERRAKVASNVPSKGSGTSSDGGDAGKKAESSDDNSGDSDSDSDYGSDEEEDDDDENENGIDEADFVARDNEAGDFQGTKTPQGGLGGNGMRVTVRNLRIREDTPKYLRNLALDSAFYDPKSRAMRANPLPNENPEELAFAGDNFVRHGGDSVKMAKNQLLCWEMQARGENVDVISNPSQAELLHRQFAEKKEKLENSKKAAILAKYGDSNTNKQMDPRLKLGQTEAYLEYNREGRLVKGVPTAVVRTKYEEDVFTHNHTSVWGSYYNRARAVWGYACCHSSLKNSFCTGEKGKLANDSANSEAMDAFQARRKMLDEKTQGADGSDKTAGKTASSSFNLTKRSELYGDATSASLDPEKMKEAAARATSSSSTKEEGAEENKKRGYNSMGAVDVTAEDMEVYRMKKVKADDPMAAFMNSDTLLE